MTYGKMTRVGGYWHTIMAYDDGMVFYTQCRHTTFQCNECVRHFIYHEEE